VWGRRMSRDFPERRRKTTKGKRVVEKALTHGAPDPFDGSDPQNGVAHKHSVKTIPQKEKRWVTAIHSFSRRMQAADGPVLGRIREDGVLKSRKKKLGRTTGESSNRKNPF